MQSAHPQLLQTLPNATRPAVSTVPAYLPQCGSSASCPRRTCFCQRKFLNAARRSSILPSAFTQPICIREDTEYLSFCDGAALPASGGHQTLSSSGEGGRGGSQAGAAPSAADETGPLPLYEDTQFLTGPSASSRRQPSGEMGAEGGTGGCGGISGGDDPIGLLVREDTCFLPDAPVAGATKSRPGTPKLPNQMALFRVLAVADAQEAPAKHAL